MAGNLITSLLSLATNLLPSITASAHAPSSSSSNSNNSVKGRAVQEDMERLMRTLKWIKATLYDAEEREIRELSVKLWLKEIKKVAYDAEDVLSEYRYEVTSLQVEARKASQASDSLKEKLTKYIVPIPDGMVDRLNKIRSRFDEIAKDREALQLRESDGLRRLNNKILRPPASHMVDEASIFGRGAEIKEIINFLLSEKEKSFSVISIVGKGGLGKTTIAQLVYKDLRDSRHFDLFGWVCVSQEFDVRRLIKATIESIFKINYGVSELSLLQEELAKIVKGKTILLVLDDVWNENQSIWELFRVPLREAKMVRILVTTRNKMVAEVMQTETCFRPTELPEDSCWQLFRHYALSDTSDNIPRHLIGMGREIMRKCGGLPLAVKSIASLLRHKTDEEDWREILESDLWESNPLNDIFPALQISYAHLPTHLKPCFLSCSMYPKDYLLHKMNLIELWISHGYIESRGKRRITEIGVEYYEELKEKSFLDDCSDQSSECCKLHDIIHDLARLNSENEHYSMEINQPFDMQKGSIPRETYHLYVRGFVGYVNQILQQNLKGLRTLSVDVRECDGDFEHEYCINNTKAMDLNSKMLEYYEYASGFKGYVNQILQQNLKGLRTSTDLRECSEDMKHKHCINNTKAMDLNLKPLEYHEECSADVTICNLPNFEALRVLELKGYGLTKIPHSIFKLKHLAYLGITASRLKMLPLSIGFLYNLQTLILDCFFLEYIPETIGNLVNLQRLVIKSDNLEEVPLDLQNLYNLHALAIHSTRIQALPNTIGCLSNLEELNLLPLSGSVKDNYKLDYMPHGLVNFPAIKSMAAWLRVKTVAWLKDINDLKGNLSFEGLDNMSNLEDAQRANLRNKCKLETLDLCWDSENYDLKSALILSIIPPESCEGMLVDVDDVDFSLLECLQPHPNLKKLRVKCYPSAIVPGWMRDPSSLQSIQEVLLEYCDNIQSLPFGNLHTLKHLKVQACDSIRVLQLEQFPSQLEELQISWCDHLELITGLEDLNMLAALEISFCQALKSLKMDGLKLVESTEPHISQQSISSLTRLKIEYCDLLRVLPDGLIPSGPCYVCVRGCGCPDLDIGIGNQANQAWKLWEQGNIIKLLDDVIECSAFATEVMRYVHVGLLCVQECPDDRPSMSSVFTMLSSDTLLQDTKNPWVGTRIRGFPSKWSYQHDSSTAVCVDQLTITNQHDSSTEVSVDQLTITRIEGR